MIDSKIKFKRNVATKLGLLIVAAITSYLFYFLMARMLSVEDYSLLYSLVAFTYLFSVPHETIRTVVALYTVNLATKKQYGKIKGFFIEALKTVFKYSFTLFLIFVALLPILSKFFHASLESLLIISFSLLTTFILPIIWGLLQGMQNFTHLGLNNCAETIIKLAIAFLFVTFGLGVNGALASIPIASLAAFLIGLWSIKDILKKKTEKFREHRKHLIRYSIAAFVIFLFFVAFYSVDIILARYFFPARISGLYSGLSVISKALLFISITILRVMFPAVAENKNTKKGKQILKTAVLYILIITYIFLLISIFIPEQLINIVVGTSYLEAAKNLKYLVIAAGFLSLSGAIVFYNLSLDWNKRLTARILGTLLFLEIALLIVFHRNLEQFIRVVLVVNILLFLALLATLSIKRK